MSGTDNATNNSGKIDETSSIIKPTSRIQKIKEQLYGASGANTSSIPRVTSVFKSPKVIANVNLPNQRISNYETVSSITKIGFAAKVLSQKSNPIEKEEPTVTSSSISASHNNNASESSLNEMDPVKERRHLENSLFKYIEDGNRDGVSIILSNTEDSSLLMQILLTYSISNSDKNYYHDSDVIQDAHALLGTSAENLNLIHLACILGDEEIADDILGFVVKETEEMEARKILLEFIGKVWGDGNTVLHLASFLGMANLVKKLLELGANMNKRNQRNYKAVDCADDDITRALFLQSYHRDNLLSRVISDKPAPKTMLSEAKSQFKSLSASEMPKPQSQPSSPPIKTPSLCEIQTEGHVTATLKKSISLPPTKSVKSLLIKKVTLETYSKLLNVVKEDSLQEVMDFIIQPDGKILNLNYQNDLGTSVWHIMAARGDLDIFKTLVELVGNGKSTFEAKGNLSVEPEIRIDDQDFNGWTPLHFAISEGHLEMTRYLVHEMHANLNILNYDGESPVDVAEEDDDDMLDFLETLVQN